MASAPLKDVGIKSIGKKLGINYLSTVLCILHLDSEVDDEYLCIRKCVYIYIYYVYIYINKYKYIHVQYNNYKS